MLHLGYWVKSNLEKVIELWWEFFGCDFYWDEISIEMDLLRLLRNHLKSNWILNDWNWHSPRRLFLFNFLTVFCGFDENEIVKLTGCFRKWLSRILVDFLNSDLLTSKIGTKLASKIVGSSGLCKLLFLAQTYTDRNIHLLMIFIAINTKKSIPRITSITHKKPEK
jgi:hypothetical protein